MNRDTWRLNVISGQIENCGGQAEEQLWRYDSWKLSMFPELAERQSLQNGWREEGRRIIIRDGKATTEGCVLASWLALYCVSGYCVCVCVCVKPRSDTWCLPRFHPILFFETRSLNPKLMNLTLLDDQQAPGILLFASPQHWESRNMPPSPGFIWLIHPLYHGKHCVTEPSPWPLNALLHHAYKPFELDTWVVLNPSCKLEPPVNVLK